MEQIKKEVLEAKKIIDLQGRLMNEVFLCSVNFNGLSVKWYSILQRMLKFVYYGRRAMVLKHIKVSEDSREIYN